MKILLEGTETQINNLLELIEKSREVLDLPIDKSSSYAIDNLWKAGDVQGTFDCSEAEAVGVMNKALINEATMNQIWYAIHFHAEEAGLKQIK